ncbi:MAG: energy transducer TonB [Candidatus Acidiferrales bacterium]
MREHKLLQDCLVDGDLLANARRRNLRRRSLLISLLVEAAILAALVLVPLAAPGKLSRNVMILPLPPYRGSAERPAVSHGPVGNRNSASNVIPLGQAQPPRIPPRIFQADDLPPGVSSARSGEGIPGDKSFGSQIPGGNEVGTQPPQPPRPRSVEKPRIPVRVSEGVQQARLIAKIIPVYPLPARNLRISGSVQLHAIIGKDGSVRSVEVVSGNPFLVGAALEAVRRWRYAPVLLDGEPVEVETSITVNFVLTN